VTGNARWLLALPLAIGVIFPTIVCRKGDATAEKASGSPSLPGPPATSAVPGKPNVSVEVSFRCLWWSPEQMNGLNPNAPPPKTTEVSIDKWEYSDPVGVPHPDKIDVVIQIKNESADAASALADVTGRWRVGPFTDEKRAEWGATSSLGREGPFRIEPSQAHTIRVPVDIATKMAELEKTEAWPYALRVDVSIADAGSQATLASAQAELPIFRGD
jgi:hypothetical protein